MLFIGYTFCQSQEETGYLEHSLMHCLTDGDEDLLI